MLVFVYESQMTGAQLKRFIVSIALTVVPMVAQGADLGLRKSYPPSAEAAPAGSNWTGAYVGLNGEWGQGAIKDRYLSPQLGAFKPTGWLGGLQAGYNHQIGDVVLGVETDYALGDVTGTQKQELNSGQPFGFTGAVGTTLSSFGSIRARAGVAMNSALFFATGGYAFGLTRVTASGAATFRSNSLTQTSNAAASDSKWMNGWVLGGGMEYAFSQHLSGNVEYLYADLRKATVFKNTWAEDEILHKVSFVRAGVNYHF